MESVMQNFAPLAGLTGGILIGLASALYLLANGRIAGISGMLEALMRPTRPGFGLAATFLLGLPFGALLTALLVPENLVQPVDIRGGLGLLIAAGVLVGFGTRLANGCTSGHGVCGLPRLSMRSMTATGLFMAAAMVTVFVQRHVL
jgi:uncharacterized protein